MPLRCHDQNGQDLHAFDLAPPDWQVLADRNRMERHLRMPCCSAAVTLRRSSRRTPYFAHKAVGDCVTAPETEIHLRFKQIAVEAARAQGWDAATEVDGMSPSGERWKADVLARKGDVAVAVEVQWSNQTRDETLRRQERYRQSGVRGLWLFQRPCYPASRDLPAAQIIVGADDACAVVSAGQRMTARSFLEAAFSGRLKFGTPLGVLATVSIRVAPVQCWHKACQARTRIVTGVDIAFGSSVRSFTVTDFSKHPDLFLEISREIPSGLGVGQIKPRFSKTAGGAYLSNGCVSCDRLFGDQFEIHARYDEEVASTFPLRVTPEWQALVERGSEDDEWAIYEVDELPPHSA